MATTPMFSPDGSLGDIPNAKIQDAVKAGFKLGVDLNAPNGDKGTVPIDKVHDAIKAGFSPFVPNEAQAAAKPPVSSAVPGNLTAPSTFGERLNAAGNPGSFEGHPENIGEYVPATIGNVVQGTKDIAKGNYSRGAHEVIKGAGNAVLPMAPVLVAGAPVAAAGAAAGGVAGQYLAKKGAQAVGATPDQQELAGDVGGIAGGIGGSKVGKLADFIPSTKAAGNSLKDIKATVGDVPINMTKPGNTALELYTQSERGANLPPVVRKFVMRATKPGSDPITYAEAKDFQSNVSSLSANERMNIKPNTMRLIGQLNADLKSSLADAADTQGKGQQFTDAMKEYHNAMRLKGWSEDAIGLVWKNALRAAGVYGAAKLLGVAKWEK